MPDLFRIQDCPSPEAFDAFLREHDMPLPMADASALGEALPIGGKSAANRVCIQPLEGFDSLEDGSPSELVYRRYRRFAESGAGVVWFESAAVSADGKSNPRQMMLSPERIPDFRALLETMDSLCLQTHGFRQYKVLQLTHSGRGARGEDNTPNPLAAKCRRAEDAAILASDERIRRLVRESIDQALMARDAGFDAVDIKACHGYFLSELLSAFNREGDYGGSFENRTRALREILEGIRREAGDTLDLTVRLNAYDGDGWGLARDGEKLVPDLKEPARLCTLLRDRGVKIINISASQPRQRLWASADEAVRPISGAYDLLRAVKELKSLVPGVPFVCSGLSAFRQFGPMIGAGGVREGWFDLAGFGRQALAYPRFVGIALSGAVPDPGRCCTGCNACFRLMNPGFAPAGCVVRDPEPYARLYREKVLPKLKTAP